MTVIVVEKKINRSQKTKASKICYVFKYEFVFLRSL